MYYRYELYVDGQPSGYGALVGAFIFALIGESDKEEYMSLVNQIPNPQFREFDGYHCVSYFKDNPSTNSLAERIAEIIEKACKDSSYPLTLEVRKTVCADLNNVVYEDSYQAVTLVEGGSEFKSSFFESDLDSLEVRTNVIFEIIQRTKKKVKQ